MFSPIVATRFDQHLADRAAFGAGSLQRSWPRSPPFVERGVGDIAHSVLELSLRATKSVSEFTSTTAADVPPDGDADQAFGRDAAGLLGGLERPFARSQSIAASMSPLVSTSAFLQSIMPAPVFSRSLSPAQR